MRLICSILLCLVATSVYAGGEWLADKRTGCKVFWESSPKFSESITWSGDCKNGIANGKGTLNSYKNGKLDQSYKGMQKNGRNHGKAIVTSTEGYILVFESKDGVMGGKCKLTHVQKDKGPFAMTAHKVGEILWVYEGECNGEILNGKGTIEYSSGAKFTGDFVKGRQGKGTRFYRNGDIYIGEGNTKQGQSNYYKNGTGTMTYATGDKYSGGWLNNKKHGMGTTTLPDGSSYKALWENGLKIKIF